MISRVKDFLLFAGSIIMLNLANSNLLAQAPDYTWYQTYGTTEVDAAEWAVQSSDGGYLVVGYTYDTDSSTSDIYLIKTDAYGEIIWENRYGGSADEWASCIQPASDGGYIISGGTDSYGAGETDVWLLKINDEGTEEWKCAYGGQSNEYGNYILPTSDDCYVIVGWTNSFGAGNDDIYLIKTDKDGNLLWQRTFGGQFYDKGFEVCESADGGYAVVAGVDYFAYSPANACLIKIDADGDSLWASVLGGWTADAGNALAMTSDGGFLVVGWTMSYGQGEADVYAVKVDSRGQQLWYNTYGGADRDIGRAVISTSNGGFVITGYTYSQGDNSQDIYLVGIDSTGDSLWATTFGGSGDDYALCVLESDDGGYIVAGGTSTYGYGLLDAILLKFSGEPIRIDPDDLPLPGNIVLGQNYPNPFNESTIITFTVTTPDDVALKIYDTLGREVAELLDNRVDTNRQQVVFNAADLASGVYFYKIQAGNEIQTKKMMLVK